jgi:hypothetical protein
VGVPGTSDVKSLGVALGAHTESSACDAVSDHSRNVVVRCPLYSDGVIRKTKSDVYLFDRRGRWRGRCGRGGGEWSAC